MNTTALSRVDSLALTEAERIIERVSFALRRVQKNQDLRSIEASLEKKLAALFLRQGQLFLARFEALRGYFTEAPGPQAWQPAFDAAVAETKEGFATAIDKGIEDAMKKGAKRFTSDLGMEVRFDLANPRAVDYLRVHAGSLIASDVNATTKKYINTVMTNAANTGQSYDQAAKAITDRYSEFAVGQPQLHIDSRAHLIAITELAQGYEEANLVMAQEMADGGIPMQKHWLTVHDNRVDATCTGNEARGWVPSEEAFPSGDMRPPEHPACRCTTQYQVAPLEGEVAPVPEGPPLAETPDAGLEDEVSHMLLRGVSL